MDLKSAAATILGAVAIVAFGAFSIYLMKHIGEGQTQWDRLVYVFGGIEAIAFAAAGYFFGREAHRQRAEKAEGEAREAEKKAEKAETEANTERSDKVKAETKFASLIKYIDANAPTKTPHILGLDHLLNASKTHHLAAEMTDLTAAIDTTRGIAVSADDQRWSALAKFAKSL